MCVWGAWMGVGVPEWHSGITRHNSRDHRKCHQFNRCFEFRISDHLFQCPGRGHPAPGLGLAWHRPAEFAPGFNPAGPVSLSLTRAPLL